ncbi:YlaH-like family protein [Bacillus sp. V3B]|uniref:YlaH-like family protein n=1 Tax=Bacillus sp. V3B TaxID=2804915 RepID=UPI00210872D3|nr:YlaH-like family protein [Bacillus sp. V3B]MCQ6275122.1 YlaH-like family protein [Bacillus sp. V3B]
MDISERLSFFAALYRVDENSDLGMWLLYITILLLSILVFKLGFAQKLPLLKSVIIYLFLIFGCAFLSFLGIFLPITEGLVVAALILIIYKIRLHRYKNA